MFDESLQASGSAEVLKEIKNKVDSLYNLKLEADKAEKKYKEAKNELSKILEESGVDKVQGDSCTVSLALKNSCTFPKEISEKKRVLDYIQKNHGLDVVEEMTTINARTFSSWVDREVEAKAKEGDIDFKVPGTNPYEYYSLSLRKRTVKK